MRHLRSDDPGFEAAFAAFLAAPRGQPADVDAAVADILEGVRTGGVAALLDYARRFDRVELTVDTLGVTADEIAAGVAATPPDILDAIRFAADRIGTYHARQRPQDTRFVDEAGVELGWRWGPLEAVGMRALYFALTDGTFVGTQVRAPPCPRLCMCVCPCMCVLAEV